LAANKAEKIDELMTTCYATGLYNGSVLIARDGEIIYHRVFGFADFETGEKLDMNSPFYIASISKQFTAMSIMMLNEQKRLRYDDTLSKYFPELPAYANQITIRHLLTHTSGLPDHLKSGNHAANLSNQDVLDFLVKRDSLAFRPGEQFAYSNSGYVLLAMIIEKASGRLYHTFLKESIFEPLDMHHSLVYDESKPTIPGRSVGYNMFGEEDDYNILTTGAGGIYSTAEDLFKWDQALYQEKIVKAQTLKEAFAPYTLHDGRKSYYGYGWRIVDCHKGKTVEHAGRFGGFKTYLGRQLGRKETIILLTNKGHASPLDGIRSAIGNILGNQHYLLPKRPIALKLFEIIGEKGLQAALEQYHVLKLNRPDAYSFGKFHLLYLGRHLLYNRSVEDAVQVFRLNAEEYPSMSIPYGAIDSAYRRQLWSKAGKNRS
jgi:CubicO group peptidase (beta-lactamase class C family)